MRDAMALSEYAFMRLHTSTNNEGGEYSSAFVFILILLHTSAARAGVS